MTKARFIEEAFVYLSEIIEFAYRVSNTTEHDVFVEYYAHTNEINVDMYIGGWVYSHAKKELINNSMYLDNYNQSSLDELKEIRDDISRLLEGDN